MSEFLSPRISPFFAVKLIIRNVFLLSVSAEYVTPYCRRNRNNNIVQRSEKKALPGMTVFVDTGVVCPLFAFVLVFHKNKQTK